MVKIAYLSFASLACSAAVSLDFLRLQKPAEMKPVADLCKFLKIDEDPVTWQLFWDVLKQMYPESRNYKTIFELTQGIDVVRSKLELCVSDNGFDAQLMDFCLALSWHSVNYDLRHLDYRVMECA